MSPTKAIKNFIYIIYSPFSTSLLTCDSFYYCCPKHNIYIVRITFAFKGLYHVIVSDINRSLYIYIYSSVIYFTQRNINRTSLLSSLQTFNYYSPELFVLERFILFNLFPPLQ